MSIMSSASKANTDAALPGAAVFIFVACFLGFYIAPVRTPWDSWFSIHTTYSLLHGNWGSLKDFASFFPTHHSLVVALDGQPFSFYPIGPSLFAIPTVVIADLVVPNLAKLLMVTPVSAELEALTVAFWCSTATIMMLYLSARVSGNNLVGIIAAFVFAFCSPIFSTATRALWQHGPLVVCILVTMLVLQAATRRPNLIPLAGLSVAAAFVCRPLSAPFIALVSGYVALYHRERLIHFLAAGAAVAMTWMAYNHAVWGSLLPPYYIPSSHGNYFNHWRGRILGPLISPGRGLFVFCPVFLFSIVGVILKARTRSLDRFDVLYIATIIGHIVVIAFTPMWWAGHSFGPRFMTDIVPMLVYLMLPAIGFVASNFQRASGSITGVFMAISIVISLLINSWGAFNFAVSEWNPYPINIDTPEGYPRLWDWHDLQFLRGTTLEKPYPWTAVLSLVRKQSNK